MAWQGRQLNVSLRMVDWVQQVKAEGCSARPSKAGEHGKPCPSQTPAPRLNLRMPAQRRPHLSFEGGLCARGHWRHIQTLATELEGEDQLFAVFGWGEVVGERRAAKDSELEPHAAAAVGSGRVWVACLGRCVMGALKLMMP